MRKLSITIDDELYAQLKRTIGTEDLSDYVADAVRDRLEAEESLDENGSDDEDEGGDEEDLDEDNEESLDEELEDDEDWEEESDDWNSDER